MFNFRPVSNLHFVSTLIEKAVFLQLNDYLLRDGLHEPLQSSYLQSLAQYRDGIH